MATNLGDSEQVPYEITYQAIVDPKIQKLPEPVQKELDELLVNNRKDAEKAIPRLLALKQQYPKIPLIYNYLSVAYGFTDLARQKQAIQENYQQNPNYLFARCHYAQLCLREKQYDKIPGIFEKKFDLKALYPRRKQFHANEYAAFAGVLCAYFKAIGETEKAQYIYDCMRELVPNAAETRQAKALMQPGFFSRVGAKMVAVLSN
ncbi:hypothetical protein Q9L42_007020 [Methylomarinum sp. Ch1-1]|uniref:Tetratricopeptide repeat protein n=1 Tax=Methylomarinum roseum TaxID=3067653 RepID=A0AAU7NY56_9GAMM|nr:hypothetical protein [Methylomarinum sp. Ch1-1]MDP4522035.1 hypothetical protein [Methylomarinum sp. Ch1-1]